MRYIIGLAMMAACVLTTGCRSPNRQEGVVPSADPVSVPPNRHQIFSPNTTETLAWHDYDTSWPAAVDSYQSLEVIDYRETIRDRQYHWGTYDDHYQRRFDAVRVGRMVR